MVRCESSESKGRGLRLRLAMGGGCREGCSVGCTHSEYAGCGSIPERPVSRRAGVLPALGRSPDQTDPKQSDFYRNGALPVGRNRKCPRRASGSATDGEVTKQPGSSGVHSRGGSPHLLIQEIGSTSAIHSTDPLQNPNSIPPPRADGHGTQWEPLLRKKLQIACPFG